MNAGLQILQEKKAQGCFVEGDPKYYSRFGFKAYPGLTYSTGKPEYWFVLPLHASEVPMGKVEVHAAFFATDKV